MATFEYEATDEHGARVAGRVIASSLGEASERLWQEGHAVSSMRRVDRPLVKPSADIDQFSLFNRQLAEMVAAGIPIERSVAEIARGMSAGSFRSAIGRVSAALRDGKTLSDAITAEREFPPAYAAMVTSGLASGDLARSLMAVARNAEGVCRVRRAIAQALAYPALVMILAVVSAAAFALICVPHYERMYRMFGMTPPAGIAVARILTQSVYVPLACVLCLAAMLAGLRFWVRSSPAGEGALARVPLIGRLSSDVRLVRFLQCLAVFVRAGTPAIASLPVAVVASGSAILRRDAEAMRARLAEGGSLADALKVTSFVPSYVAAQVAGGESGGRLADELDALVDVIEEGTVTAAGDVGMLLRPAAIAATGALLVGVFVSIASPYFSFLGRMAA